MPDNHLSQTLGSKTTTYDQRNQQVERQVNVVIYQGREIAIPGVEASAAHLGCWTFDYRTM